MTKSCPHRISLALFEASCLMRSILGSSAAQVTTLNTALGTRMIHCFFARDWHTCSGSPCRVEFSVDLPAHLSNRLVATYVAILSRLASHAA
mmetsp:Transcript_80902/g.121613  ORF Transcript_80902/g.121613 Transcript_80902/m.121613 type:complete len:92 (-) Transcript_80902:2041-2316(-)